MAPASSHVEFSRLALSALLVAVSTVAAGYGITLPLIPQMLQAVDGSEASARIARHTGFLIGLHTFALFLFAPLWGTASDRFGRKPVLVAGLLGFGASLLLALPAPSMMLLYAERFFTGAFAAGIAPVAKAVIADQDCGQEWQSRRMAWIGMAAISGFLIGPMLSAVLAATAVPMVGSAVSADRTFELPLLVVSVVALIAAAAVITAVPAGAVRRASAIGRATAARSVAELSLVQSLRLIGFLVAGGVGVFEVGLALRGNEHLRMSAAQASFTLTTCSLIMFGVQAMVFSPFIKPASTRWLIAPATGLMAMALLLTPHVTLYGALLAMVWIVSASAGILTPILSYWISLLGGARKGAELGRQAALGYLGQALGSIAGGAVPAFASTPALPFVLFAVLLGGMALWCLVLPFRLVGVGSESGPRLAGPTASTSIGNQGNRA